MAPSFGRCHCPRDMHPILLILLLCSAGAQSLLAASAQGGTSSPLCTPRIVLQFPGIAQYPTVDGDPEKPSDVNIAVGPGSGKEGRIVQVTNNGIQLFDKTGRSVAGPVALEEFVGAPPNDCFDPKLLYDQHSGRFLVVMPGTKNSRTSRLHLAVSATSAPSTLKEGWIHFADDGGTTVGAHSTWMDYPCLGADRDSLFVTANLADSNKVHRGAKIRVYDKAALLNGRSLFTDLDLEATLPGGGVATLQPAHSWQHSALFHLISRCGPDRYRLWKIAGAPRAPRLVSGSGPYTWDCGNQVRSGAPQKGESGVTLHTSSGRVMGALYRGGFLWCTLSADVTQDGRTEVLWFRIAPGGEEEKPHVSASGACGAGSAAGWTFVPSLGVDGAGRALLCFTEASSAQYAEMRVACAGESTSSVMVAASAGEYDGMDRHNPEKWADYSSCVPDPERDGLFWVAHEVCTVPRGRGDDARWGTVIACVALTP